MLDKEGSLDRIAIKNTIMVMIRKDLIKCIDKKIK